MFRSSLYGSTHTAIHVESVSKSYSQSWRKRRSGKQLPPALADVSLRIAQHESVAIVGVNGSGKSTLVRILATLTTPDAGNVFVFGHDVVREAKLVRTYINRVSVEASFFKQMSPWENLVYAGRLYGQTGKQIEERATTLLQRLGLPGHAVHRPMNGLSRGQQQKVAIVRSLLSKPAILLLDEPTTGLDPRSKHEVQDVVQELHEETDLTIVLCTHDLAEAEALCSRIVVLDHGKLIGDGTSDQLRAENGISPQSTMEQLFLAMTGRSFLEDEESGGETS
ncbi:MAG: ABC transporter ATP-binding protein [Candidatus Dormibacteria bacterium]